MSRVNVLRIQYENDRTVSDSTVRLSLHLKHHQRRHHYHHKLQVPVCDNNNTPPTPSLTDTPFAIITNLPQTTKMDTSQSKPFRPSPFPHDPHPRLSLTTPSRITLGSTLSALIGFSLGATQGGATSNLRFRAEHAHKMPDSTAGWYLYHKSKNYHAMQGGIAEGFRMAARTGLWSFMALGLESTVDQWRGRSDLFSTVVASLSVAGAFSLWREFFFATFPYLFCFI